MPRRIFTDPIKTFVPYFTWATHRLADGLTSLFYGRISSLKDAISRKPMTRYNIKVTFYNLTVIGIVWNAVSFYRSHSSFQSTATITSSLIFIRMIAHRSLNKKAFRTELTKFYLEHKKGWNENLFSIGPFVILKNWHVTIPNLIQKIARRVGLMKPPKDK